MKASLPKSRGHFGPYGGQYVAETLMPALSELEAAWAKAKRDRKFQKNLAHALEEYVGRPTPLTYCARLTEKLGGAKIYLKREDLCHTGAHKINNTVGQAQLARWMGKPRLIAETGAGQHGVATATVAAWMGFECVVYMGAEDVQRQSLNVFRMKLLGAEVRPVQSGSRTLKDAINEALRDWITNVRNTFYVFGSVTGPHPYPSLVRDLQSVIGKETRKQYQKAEGKLPDLLIACVGGGSNAIGLFHPFLKDKKVAMRGVEAAGEGLDKKHAATIGKGKPGVLHGAKSYLLSDDDGQVLEAHSISAGLDYPGVGPEHSYLHDLDRVQYTSATDDEALEAAKMLARTEGILPALESAHAIAEVIRAAPKMKKSQGIVVNLSGRGDKDMNTYSKVLGYDLGI